MSLDERFQLAVSSGDRQAANRAVDSLLQQVVDAIRSGDREHREEVGDSLTLAIGPWRSLLYSDEMDVSLLVGQMDALQGVLRAAADGEPSRQDLQAMSRAHAEEFVLALYRAGALRAYQVMEETGVRHQSTLSDLGEYLESCGLVRRDRRGKGASYWLTVRGNVLARYLADRQSDAHPSALRFDSVDRAEFSSALLALREHLAETPVRLGTWTQPEPGAAAWSAWLDSSAPDWGEQVRKQTEAVKEYQHAEQGA